MCICVYAYESLYFLYYVAQFFPDSPHTCHFYFFEREMLVYVLEQRREDTQVDRQRN